MKIASSSHYNIFSPGSNLNVNCSTVCFCYILVILYSCTLQWKKENNQIFEYLASLTSSSSLEGSLKKSILDFFLEGLSDTDDTLLTLTWWCHGAGVGCRLKFGWLSKPLGDSEPAAGDWSETSSSRKRDGLRCLALVCRVLLRMMGFVFGSSRWVAMARSIIAWAVLSSILEKLASGTLGTQTGVAGAGGTLLFRGTILTMNFLSDVAVWLLAGGTLVADGLERGFIMTRGTERCKALPLWRSLAIWLILL